MEEATKENGVTTICTVMEYINGETVENTKVISPPNSKVITIWIRSTDMEYIHGQMADNMMECGRMVNNMVKEHIMMQQVKEEKAFGLTEKELNG